MKNFNKGDDVTVKSIITGKIVSKCDGEEFYIVDTPVGQQRVRTQYISHKKKRTLPVGIDEYRRKDGLYYRVRVRGNVVGYYSTVEEATEAYASSK